jgi:rSAM/selenodomain-associated transferase 2
MSLSIIMPVLDEATGIEATLTALAPYRTRGCELIVVDGGSRDGTLALARPLADRTLIAPRGRAAQMNAGASVARGDVLVFLHADTKLPENADALIRDGLAQSGRVWGRFDVRFDQDGIMPLIAVMMNLRSRLTSIATGDQAIFVTRAAFDAIGGFPAQPLMEDIALSSRIRRISRPAYIRARVTTSARRWRKQGILRTVFMMWRLRLAYFLGADPAQLARQYGYADR